MKQAFFVFRNNEKLGFDQRKFKLVKRRELSPPVATYEILSNSEVGFRGFIKCICLMFIADLNPLRSTL